MADGIPARVCERCNEYLPHWCAPVITITYHGGRDRRREVVITDRQPGPVVSSSR